MPITAVIFDHSDALGRDLIYIHGAKITNPYDNPAVIWDESVTPPVPVFVIDIEPSEDSQPYIDILETYGLTIIGVTDDMNWLLSQTRPL